MPNAAHSAYIRYHQKSAMIRRWIAIMAILIRSAAVPWIRKISSGRQSRKPIVRELKDESSTSSRRDERG